jgi:hypothetical protein
MVLPIGLHSLGRVLDSLVCGRSELATKLTIGTDFEIPDTLRNLCDAYPGRVVLRMRHRQATENVPKCLVGRLGGVAEQSLRRTLG